MTERQLSFLDDQEPLAEDSAFYIAMANNMSKAMNKAKLDPLAKARMAAEVG